MIAVIVIVVIVVLIGLFFWLGYNGLVKRRNQVDNAWSQVDVELKRRHDLIPNLVETVKGYAAQERTVLTAVTEARGAAVQTMQTAATGVAAQAQAESALGRALGGLFAVAENYPDLKSSQNFLALQQQLAETEDRIAAGRRFYNGNVRALNTRVEAFPSTVVASMFHFTKAEYFEVEGPEGRAPVAVDFSSISAPPATPGPTGSAPTDPPQPGEPPA